MALKRKIIALPTHDDITSYEHIHCLIPVGGRSTAMHTTHLSRGHAQAESRKADRTEESSGCKAGWGPRATAQQLLNHSIKQGCDPWEAQDSLGS